MKEPNIDTSGVELYNPKGTLAAIRQSNEEIALVYAHNLSHEDLIP